MTRGSKSMISMSVRNRFPSRSVQCSLYCCGKRRVDAFRNPHAACKSTKSATSCYVVSSRYELYDFAWTLRTLLDSS